ncbi:MAG: M23 family metallopeptidase [Gammaproteobacteria bacterium]|nr:M23 family metallopeptidase [Gammaproteobacteria bacterium]
MKDRITITVTDASGARHYTTHKRFRLYLLYAAAAVIVFAVGSFSTIAMLSMEMFHLDSYNGELKKKFNGLYDENTHLKADISHKIEELDDIAVKLEDIEEIVGLKPQENSDIQDRLKLVTLTSAQKNFIFQNIPSGAPVSDVTITDRYGLRVHPITGKKKAHLGIDLRAKMKTPVYATADGVVEYSGYHKNSGYGNLLIISHNYGFKTLYGHLKKFVVRHGTFVRKGDLVAYSGNSGLSNGPHLHYELRYLQKALDPLNFIRWNMQKYEDIFKAEKKVKWDYLIQAVTHQMSLSPPQLLQTAQK